MIHETLAVFDKELRDALRDRRSILSAFAYSVFGPVLIALLLGTIAESQRIDGAVAVPIAGAERAPTLVAFLEQQGAEIVSVADDPAAAVRAGDLGFALVIADDYAERWRELRPAGVELVYDASRNRDTSRRRQVAGWVAAAPSSGPATSPTSTCGSTPSTRHSPVGLRVGFASLRAGLRPA